MIRFPGNESRTSTQATIVPIAAPIAATISETIKVMTSDLIAAGDVTESKKAPIPPENALTATAASGISTITLR